MTAYAFLLVDAVLPVTKSSVAVHVEELATLSPATEDALDMVNNSTALQLLEVGLTEAGNRKASMFGQQSILCAETFQPTTAIMDQSQEDTLSQILRRREDDVKERWESGGVQMQLPSFEALGISYKRPFDTSRDRAPLAPHTAASGPFGAAPLLTPPEDVVDIKWNTAASDTLSKRQHLLTPHGPLVSLAVNRSSPGDCPDQSQRPGQSSIGQSNQHSRISLPSNTMLDQAQGGGGLAWLDQAVEHAGRSHKR